MASHPNVAVVRRLYQSFISRDTATMWEIARDDVVFHVPGRSPWAGEYRGREQILGMFVGSGKASGRSIRIELHALVGGDEHVVGMHRITGSRPGRVLNQNSCVVCHVDAGLLKDVWITFQDLRQFDEFWT